MARKQDLEIEAEKAADDTVPVEAVVPVVEETIEERLAASEALLEKAEAKTPETYRLQATVETLRWVLSKK